MQLSFDPTNEQEREFVANMLRGMMTHTALKDEPKARKKSTPTAPAESSPGPEAEATPAAPVESSPPVTREQLQGSIREFVLGGKQEDKTKKVEGVRALFTKEFGHPLTADIKHEDIGKAHELFLKFVEEWK